jgi:glucose/arabinose dehydrogenase
MVLSADHRYLYASSAATVWSWEFDSLQQTLSNRRIVVTGLDKDNIGTGMRGLAVSSLHPEILIVGRGADYDLDYAAADGTTGHGQIRYFDTRYTGNGLDFATEGTLLGWGLHNPVGFAENPVHGGIYSLDMGVDGLLRDGLDISLANPGDELNYHGFLKDPDMHYQGGNYGYPNCFATFDPSVMPNAKGLYVGQQFAAPLSSSVIGDAACGSAFVAPQLTLEPHGRPSHIAFYPSGSWAFISFHGLPPYV